ncbi:MAG: hypothetical protein LBI79_02000 [Nitrososphaerota archaeon]|jgi:hypothetical protein|nr:hypothetical protein [Nitrososphaerota archaeon]
MRKIFRACLFALLISGLFFTGIAYAGEAYAETTPKKPAIPEFTVSFVEYSYDELPAQYIDSATGGTVTTQGYQKTKRAIEVTIKNQPSFSRLEYNIRTKGYFASEDAWAERFRPSQGFPVQSDSQYTVITFWGSSDDWFDAGISGSGVQAYPGSKIDFQVEAMNGGITQLISHPLGLEYVWTGEKSGWSNTVTLTMSAYNNEVSNQLESMPSATSNGNQPQSPNQTYPKNAIFTHPATLLIVGAIFGGAIVAAGLLIYFRKISHHFKAENYE